jgi:hypothetical protein
MNWQNMELLSGLEGSPGSWALIARLRPSVEAILTKDGQIRLTRKKEDSGRIVALEEAWRSRAAMADMAVPQALSRNANLLAIIDYEVDPIAQRPSSIVVVIDVLSGQERWRKEFLGFVRKIRWHDDGELSVIVVRDGSTLVHLLRPKDRSARVVAEAHGDVHCSDWVKGHP